VRLAAHAGSAGRTTRPFSSIHTPIGTLMNWKTELTVCLVSTSCVNVAFAASYHLPAAGSPPTSCAAAMISKSRSFSSA
jgi:hypothetical protein